MKLISKLSLLLVVFSCFSAAYAQEGESFEYTKPTYNIAEEEATFSIGENNAFIITIPDVNISDVEKEWKKYLKDYKGKAEGEYTEIIAKDLKIKPISKRKRVNNYTKMATKEKDVAVTSTFIFEDQAINTANHPDKVVVVKNMLNNFALIFAKRAIEQELEVNEEEYENRFDVLKKLQKENGKLLSTLEKYQKKAEEAQKAVDANLETQAGATKSLHEQEEVVDKIKKKLSVFDD